MHGVAMLVSFSVTNFLSFENKQTISMNAGLVRKKSDRVYKDIYGNRLVKFAAIYGANASGKSNIIEAFAFSRAMIVHGLPSGSTKKYCRTTDENKKKSTVSVLIRGLYANPFLCQPMLVLIF